MKRQTSRPPRQLRQPPTKGKAPVPRRNDGLNPGRNRQPYSKASQAKAGGAQREVSVAAAYASGQRSAPPKIQQMSRDSVRIVHRELVASVTGSVGFVIPVTLSLNPGLQAAFPWLASQAQSWERYRFNKLKFCYYTRTGSTTPGSVQLIPDYDASDAAPVSEQIASSYEDVEEDAPWKDIECELRPAALNALGPSKFIRSAILGANQDIKTYDSGNFFLATTDGTAVPWGKLWVEYDVTLMTPQLNPGGNQTQIAFAAAGATPTSANMLGAAPAQAANSSPIVTVVGEVVTFNQAGQFLLAYAATASTSVTVTGAPAISASGTILYSANAGSGTLALLQSDQVIAVVGTTLTYNNAIVGGIASQLIVSQLPTNLGAD
jgi:hypothetical protein